MKGFVEGRHAVCYDHDAVVACPCVADGRFDTLVGEAADDYHRLNVQATERTSSGVA